MRNTIRTPMESNNWKIEKLSNYPILGKWSLEYKSQQAS
jgi:hypothetical protein